MATCCETSPQPFVTSPTSKKQSQSTIVVSVSECVYGEWDGSQSLVDEFRTLQMLTDKPMSFGERILNFPSATTYWTSAKNRYPDILPREDTRVRLQHTGCEGSDYINANFVFEKQYIATQAPLYSTFADFWRMVWEQGACIIVMLTRLTENGVCKANVYWPAHLGEKIVFGMLTVELIHETAFDNIECRLLRISDGTEHRDVSHLHYTGWPDFGVPANTKEIIDLVKVTNYLRARAGWEKPIVTHCSAGVGRVGTFIGIHQAVRLLNATKTPKILDLVFAMRQCRHGMVQREEQYVFIHRVVADYERHMEEEAAAAAVAASNSPSAASLEAARKDNQKRQRRNRCSMDEPLRDALNKGAENRAAGAYVPEGGLDLLIS
eukprot:Mycagemm_TRINITY_DN10038_c0_g1::TRINITY_DN10038_c0_g1_i1::g.2016::m.2016 type:complete len:379 gc:universal TRINITY_DN10038_c0_g1_i1:106-1242(+)